MPQPLPTVPTLPAVSTQRSPEYGLSTFIWGNPNTTGRDLKRRTLELECALRLATTLGSHILAATERGH